MTLDSMISVLQAAKDGKAIQCRFNVHDAWSPVDTSDALWNFAKYEYRVKPEPRTVWVGVLSNGDVCAAAFKSQEDCQRSYDKSSYRVKPVKFVEVIE